LVTTVTAPGTPSVTNTASLWVTAPWLWLRLTPPTLWAGVRCAMAPTPPGRRTEHASQLPEGAPGDHAGASHPLVRGGSPPAVRRRSDRDRSLCPSHLDHARTRPAWLGCHLLVWVGEPHRGGHRGVGAPRRGGPPLGRPGPRNPDNHIELL